MRSTWTSASVEFLNDVLLFNNTFQFPEHMVNLLYTGQFRTVLFCRSQVSTHNQVENIQGSQQKSLHNLNTLFMPFNPYLAPKNWRLTPESICKINMAVGKHLFTAGSSLFLYWARSRSISLQDSKSLWKGATAYIQHACHSTNRHDCTRRYISTCLPKECLWFNRVRLRICGDCTCLVTLP